MGNENNVNLGTVPVGLRSRAHRIVLWVEKEWKVVLVAIGVLVVVAVGAALYNSHLKSARLAASTELYKALQLGGDARVEALKGLVDAHSNKKVAAVGAMYLASDLFAQGKYEDVLTTLSKYENSGMPKELRGLVGYFKGVTLESLGKYDDAIALYDKLSSDKNSPIKGVALYSLAGTYESAGNIEKAKELYTKISESSEEEASAELRKMSKDRSIWLALQASSSQ